MALKTLFMGTPDIAIPTIEFLHENSNIDLCYIVSMPDRPSGRGHKLKSPDVIEYAKKNNIAFFQTQNINKENEFLEKLALKNIDIIIVFAFAQFLGKRVLELPQIGCFNIHTSLLPLYRGAAPIQYAILNGDDKTGVSIQKMVKKMDAGDIATSVEVDIDESDTASSLYEKLKYLAPKALENLINDIKNNSLHFTPQDESKVSFAPTLKKENGYLSFKEKTAKQIHNQVRGFFPWPGTYCFMNNKRLKVLETEVVEEKLRPGELSDTNKKIIVGCLEKSIWLKKVQLEGKKPSSDADLLNGLRDKLEITE